MPIRDQVSQLQSPVSEYNLSVFLPETKVVIVVVRSIFNTIAK